MSVPNPRSFQCVTEQMPLHLPVPLRAVIARPGISGRKFIASMFLVYVLAIILLESFDIVEVLKVYFQELRLLVRPAVLCSWLCWT